MAKFCTNCGSELPENGVCPNCSAAPAEPITVESAPKSIPATITVPAEDRANKVNAWGFFGLILLFLIPVVGWIAAIVLAFAPENKTVKSFSRGTLLVKLLSLILSVILLITSINIVLGVADYFNGYIHNSGEYDSLDEALESIHDDLGFDLGGLLEDISEIGD